jgi:Protein of unknown function (DUF3303)
VPESGPPDTSHRGQSREEVDVAKYVLEFCVRPGIGGQQAEADTVRAYELYSKWQPKVKILQFVGRIDSEGGFMICEADNPADILEGTSKLQNYVQYKCHPVVDVDAWVQAGQEGISFRHGIS